MANSSLFELEPGGISLLAMVTAVSRGALICLMFDRIRREGTSDTLFPNWAGSREGCRWTYWMCGVSCVFLKQSSDNRIVSSFVSVYFEDLSLLSKIWLPTLTAAFASSYRSSTEKGSEASVNVASTHILQHANFLTKPALSFQRAL